MTAVSADDVPDPATAALAPVLAAVEHALGGRITSVQPLSGSIDNQVLALRHGEQHLILKHGPVEGMRREAAVLALLRDTGVPVPALVPACLGDDVLLMAAWEGQPAAPDSPALTEAGRSLRTLHGLRLPGFGLVSSLGAQPRGRDESWAEFVHGTVHSGLDAVPETVLAVPLRTAIAAELPRYDDHLATVRTGVLLHGDLVPKHVWTDHGRLVGLIDWGDALVGDPLYDLARFSMAGPEDLHRLLDGCRPTDPPDPGVLGFYRMVWALTALAVECRAGGDWVDGYVSTIRAELDPGGGS